MELSSKEYCKYFSALDTHSALPYVLETVTEFTSEFFGMKAYEKGRWWYGEWEGHKRKVVNLWMPKGNTRIMFWGWNYDYIPHVSDDGKIKYARTEKSFSIDIGDSYMVHRPDLNWLSGKNNDDDINTNSAGRNNYEFPNFTNNADIARAYIRGVFERNLPFMQEFFEKVKTDEACMERLDRNIEKRAESSTSDDEFVKAFILAKNGRLDEAEYLLTQSNYNSYYRDEKMLAILRKVAETRD